VASIGFWIFELRDGEMPRRIATACSVSFAAPEAATEMWLRKMGCCALPRGGDVVKGSREFEEERASHEARQ
jgi:hypothetical protein